MNKIYLIFVLLLGLNAPVFGQFPGTPNFFNAGAAVPVSPCGAFVAAGVYKAFMCHNLGADTSADPNVPIQAIFGNYYQWGVKTEVATAYTQGGPISGWNSNGVAGDPWQDSSKTLDDPCPVNFKVPTKAQWEGVVSSANNTKSYTGSWSADGNFSSAISFGPDASTKTLTLPAAGYRRYDNGALGARNGFGTYWTTTAYPSNGNNWNFYFDNTSTNFYNSYPRAHGSSLRCISEN